MILLIWVIVWIKIKILTSTYQTCRIKISKQTKQYETVHNEMEYFDSSYFYTDKDVLDLKKSKTSFGQTMVSDLVIKKKKKGVLIMKKLTKYLLLIISIVGLLVVGCSNTKSDTSKENESKAETTEDVAADLESSEDVEVNEEISVEEESEPVEILVAAAASLQNAMEEIQVMYQEQNPNVTVTFTFGSSGALQQQIEQGAPVDVFMSAALTQMTALEEKDLIVKETKKELLENKVVLIVPKDSKLGITSFENILKAPMIALGDPESVPVGQYSEEVFTSLGILDKIKENVTYAKDVTEVLTWVSSGNADAGVVYATDTMSSDAVTVVAQAPEGSCSKVIYPVAVVKDTEVLDDATAFVEYLASAESIAVFEEYGFTAN